MKLKTTIEFFKDIPSRTLIDAYRTFLKEMLEECEKYRWHDLKKNPYDLPNKGDDIEVILHDGTHRFMFLDFCIEEDEYMWYSSYPYEGEVQPRFYVRAWREVKPWEEEG